MLVTKDNVRNYNILSGEKNMNIQRNSVEKMVKLIIQINCMQFVYLHLPGRIFFSTFSPLLHLTIDYYVCIHGK